MVNLHKRKSPAGFVGSQVELVFAIQTFKSVSGDFTILKVDLLARRRYPVGFLVHCHRLNEGVDVRAVVRVKDIINVVIAVQNVARFTDLTMEVSFVNTVSNISVFSTSFVIRGQSVPRLAEGAFGCVQVKVTVFNGLLYLETLVIKGVETFATQLTSACLWVIQTVLYRVLNLNALWGLRV